MTFKSLINSFLDESKLRPVYFPISPAPKSIVENSFASSSAPLAFSVGNVSCVLLSVPGGEEDQVREVKAARPLGQRLFLTPQG